MGEMNRRATAGREVPEPDGLELTRRNLMLRFGAAGAALAATGSLAGCFGGGGDDDNSSTSGGQASTAEIDRVTWGISGQAPTGLDIATNYYTPAIAAASLALEGLVLIDGELKLQPALARSWTQPDNMHYVFDLREGVRFSDGSPLTVEDVVFSLNRHLDKDVGSLIGFHFANVKSIEASGDSQVTVTLRRPDPTIPGVMVFSHIGSKAFIERTGRKYGVPGAAQPVLGTGPYVIDSFTTESGVEVARNPGYWGAAPKVKAGALKFFDNPQTSRLAAQAGEIDGLMDFPLSTSREWDRLQGYEALYSQSTNFVYLSFDVTSEPWSDIHVRRAVAHCADLTGYVNAFTNGKGTPALAMVPKALWANVASEADVDAIYEQIPQYPFDIERARAELAQSAFPDGFEAQTIVPSERPEWERALVSLSESLRQIGITLKVKSVPLNEWLAALNRNTDTALTVGGGGSDYPDPGNILMIFYPSENAVPGRFNLAHFKNKRVDELLDAQNAATDPAERARLIGEILKISGEQVPYLSLWWSPTTGAHADEYVFNGFNSFVLEETWLAKVEAAA